MSICRLQHILMPLQIIAGFLPLTHAIPILGSMALQQHLKSCLHFAKALSEVSSCVFLKVAHSSWTPHTSPSLLE